MQELFCRSGRGDPSDDKVSNGGGVFQAVLIVNTYYAETVIYTQVLLVYTLSRSNEGRSLLSKPL